MFNGTKCYRYGSQSNAVKCLGANWVTLALVLSIWTTGIASAAEPNTAAATASSATTSSSLAETTIHLYYLVGGYTDILDPTNKNLCSAPGAQLKVGVDNGTTLTVAIDAEKPVGTRGSREEKTGTCVGKYVLREHQYTIDKSSVLTASPTIQGLVSGILAVPFKYHLSDHSTTAASTIGGYVGYRSSVANQFSVTPVIAGGLALISTSPAQVTTPSTGTSTKATTAAQTSGSQTSAGVSIATGMIGSVTSAASKGAQFGVLLGMDWLGKKSNYAYEGKLWVAFEIGYNFAL